MNRFHRIPFTLALTDMAPLVRELAVRPRAGGEDWLLVPRVEAKVARLDWPASRVEVGEARVSEPPVLAWRNPDGRFNWQEALEGFTAGRPRDGAKRWTAKIATSPRIETRASMPG